MATPTPILAVVTEGPWQPGQPTHRHASADPEADAPATPVWLLDTTVPVPPPEPFDENPPPVRTYRTAVVALSVVLGLVLVGGGVLTGYLLRVNAAWQQHSQEWQALATQHGADLAQAQFDLESTRTELQGVRDQLATAQARITQLADEKAQLGDESAAQQQLTDYQQRVSHAAGQVATALSSCIDGQQQLITLLGNQSAWDPAQLATFKQQVNDYCAGARAANASLQAELAK